MSGKFLIVSRQEMPICASTLTEIAGSNRYRKLIQQLAVMPPTTI
jgi:hypothetical protein